MTKVARHPLTLCMSGKNGPRNAGFRALPAGRRTGGAGLCRRRSSCSAARIPVQNLGSVHPRPRPPARAKPNSNACAASHTVPVAVLCCCTHGPAVRITLLTSGAKGTRTPDPLLANNRQHVHPRPSPQVTVLERVSASPWIRTCCGTFVLYSCKASAGGRGCACAPCARQRQGGRSVCRHEYLGPT